MAITHDMGIPSTYREIFVLLHKNGIIDEDLAKEMSRLVTCRNLLSHECREITREQVFELIQNVGTMKKCAHRVQENIRERS